MPALNFVEFNVLLATCNDRICHHTVESHEEGLEVGQLARHYLDLFKSYHVEELVDQDHVPDLMVLARETEKLRLRPTGDTHRVDRLQRRLKGKQALARGVCSLEAIQRPDRHLVIFRFFLQALADREGEVLVPRPLLNEELVYSVGVPLVEKSLLLKRRVVAQEQVGLRIEDLLRELGVWVEKDLPRRVVWMPAHDPV